MTNQNNMQLREYAAFAASHSVACQQATYLGGCTRRLAAIVADQYFQRGVTSDAVSSQGEHITINQDYDMKTREILEEMTRNKWEKLVSKRRQEDLQILPKPGKELTPDVSINALQLVVVVGCDGVLGQKLQMDILELFLSGRERFNNRKGRAVFLAMMDFAPELEACKILQENLDI